MAECIARNNHKLTICVVSRSLTRSRSYDYVLLCPYVHAGRQARRRPQWKSTHVVSTQACKHVCMYVYLLMTM